jgi:hypothetical protein
MKNYLKPNGRFYLIDLDQEDGSFHQDPQKMGVHHFGFSIECRDSWCEKAGYKSVSHETVFEISKNERTYLVIMSIYKS